MEEAKKVRVRNKTKGTVGYVIPDLNNLRRKFQPGEVKVLTEEEIFKLSQIPGGNYILKHDLTIEDAEVVDEIVGEVEPEYFYTEQDVIKIMNEGSRDEFEDMLNFAPEGIISVIKNLAVSLPLNDIAKRDLLFKRTGFNVTNAIELAKDDEKVAEAKPQRKAAPPTTAASKPTRKVVKPSAS